MGAITVTVQRLQPNRNKAGWEHYPFSAHDNSLIKSDGSSAISLCTSHLHPTHWNKLSLRGGLVNQWIRMDGVKRNTLSHFCLSSSSLLPFCHPVILSQLWGKMFSAKSPEYLFDILEYCIKQNNFGLISKDISVHFLLQRTSQHLYTFIYKCAPTRPIYHVRCLARGTY